MYTLHVPMMLALLMVHGSRVSVSLCVLGMLLMGSGCKTSPTVPGAPPADAANAATATVDRSLKPGMGAPTDFTGTCGTAQDTGELAEYNIPLRAKRFALGYIRVRATPQFTGGDYSNVLAQVPSGTILSGKGPLKNAEVGNAIGYAVAMRDNRGKVCKGYVSFTVVEPAPPVLQVNPPRQRGLP